MDAKLTPSSPTPQYDSWACTGCTAVKVVTRVVVDSVFCSLVAALVVFVLAQGAFASGKTPDQQSLPEFVLAISAWSSFAICATILVVVVQGMEGKIRRVLMATDPGVQARRSQRALRVLQLVCLPWAVLAAAHSLGTYALAVVSPTAIVDRDAHLYVLVVGVIPVQVTIEVAAVEVLHAEIRRAQVARQHVTHSLVARILRIVRQQWPSWLMVFAMSAFTHLAAALRSINAPNKAKWCTAVSLLIKVSLQELGKLIILRRKTVEPAVLILVIAIPTLMVDTQLRIALIDFQHRQQTAGQDRDSITQWINLLVLAPVELIIRMVKIVILIRQLRRRGQQTGPGPSDAAIQRIGSQLSSGPTDAFLQRVVPRAGRPRSPRASAPSTRRTLSVTSKHEKLLLFHATETTAEMCAEYIAIGCSTSMSYLLSNHPRYQYDGTTSAGVVSSLSAVSMLVQVSSEMVVDFACSVMELRSGVPLTTSRDFKGLVLTMFTLTTIGSVCLSALAYTTWAPGSTASG